MLFGLTPVEPIVTVLPGEGVGSGVDGPDDDLLLHAARIAMRTATRLADLAERE
jgi:hypothetical protein